MTEEEKVRQYGEFGYYRTEEEKEETEVYLNLWKTVFMRKIEIESGEVDLKEGEWVDKPILSSEDLYLAGTLGLKIWLTIDEEE